MTVRIRLPNGEVWERRGLAWALVNEMGQWQATGEVVTDEFWPEYVDTVYDHWKASGRPDQSNSPVYKPANVPKKRAERELSKSHAAEVDRAWRLKNRDKVNAQRRARGRVAGGSPRPPLR